MAEAPAPTAVFPSESLRSLEDAVLSHPERLCSVDASLSSSLKSLLKSFYDYSKGLEPVRLSPLSSLMVFGLSSEQIWDELRVQTHLRSQFPKLTQCSIRLFPVDLPVSLSSSFPSGPSGAAASSKSDPLDSESEEAEEEEEEEEEGMEDGGEEEEEEGDELESDGSVVEEHLKRVSDTESLDRDEEGYKVREDVFFKESDMESFAEQDEKDFGGYVDSQDDEEEEEEEEGEEVEEGGEEIDFTRDLGKDPHLKYRDFFDPIDESAMPKSSQSEEETPFQRHQTKLLSRITELETKSIESKPWELRGEATSQSRPQNSLLEADLDYERQSSVAPQITEESTLSLEEVIKSRIVEESWDDVVREKVQIEEDKKEIELDSGKSKRGLADLYADDYMYESGKWDPDEKTKALEKEAEAQFAKLNYRLDSLTNFHFTPKPSVREAEIRPQVSSISMEEVIPVTMGSESRVAPEELQSSSGVSLKSKSEMTREERRRQRKEKKASHQKQQKQKEATRKESQKRRGEASGPAHRLSSKQTREVLSHPQVREGQESSEGHSSTALFRRLQSEAASALSGDASEPSQKRRKGDNSASFKL